MSEHTVCEVFIAHARDAAEQWDGVSTADLFLSILARTGEDPDVVFAEALLRYEKALELLEEED